ncbi:NAD(P)H-dependent oxidoreductase [Ilyomonas limi]|uniref:NAD(P)H-dependent oxidoreductase n=1 Tax=Ilyomonas limi TaxID=2575867 RepID=A0A4V6XAX0_9BACT|nr:NAD(P)H-dependent oxidoreductase [Ilyomonas limi]
MNILAVSGSLRSNSSNTFILKAMMALAPANVHIYLYDGIGNLPFFNPETEYDALTTVKDWRRHVQAADGIIICTPEYAFNMPGVLKNALDWLVGSGELNGKPVAAVSASPLATGGSKALFSLENTLTALGTVKSEHTLLTIPFLVKKLDAAGVLTDEVTRQQLSNVLSALIHTIEQIKMNAVE